MRSLFLDCTSGISGDMTVAALLDAGADEKVLMRAMDSIDVPGFSIKISRVTKSGLDCCDFDVILDEDNHDHDMDYLYGTAEEDSGDHHHHEHHHHEHRNLADINEIIDRVDAEESAKALAKKIFLILAEAEAKAHNTTVEEVHFHEVGAIDSIADVIAAAVCFDNLNIDEVVIPKLCDGQGSVRCQHGVIPVPVPAVLNIATGHKLPLSVTEKEGEFVTPTGAAFAAAVMTTSQLPEVFVPKVTGMGAGKRANSEPGILRAIIY